MNFISVFFFLDIVILLQRHSYLRKTYKSVIYILFIKIYFYCMKMHTKVKRILCKYANEIATQLRLQIINS